MRRSFELISPVAQPEVRVVRGTPNSGTPSINVDVTDLYIIEGLSVAITSFTAQLRGTMKQGQQLEIRLKDNGTARAVTMGASFASAGATLPTTTVISKYLRIYLEGNIDASRWDCIGVAQE